MGVATTIILRNFEDNLVFFFTPSQWQEKLAAHAPDRPVRIGGLVKTGSVQGEGNKTRFTITDLMHDMPVTYTGLLPSLFREGQGAVAEGTVDETGTLNATTILAKHDENYMPKEVVDQLKASGRWQEYSGAYGAGDASATATAPPLKARANALRNVPTQGSE